MIALARRWLAGRSDRERRLVTGAGSLAALALAGGVLGTVRDDLAGLRARVDGHERELVQVRRLATTLGVTATATGEGALVPRVQAAADAAGLGDRVAAMTPVGEPGHPDDPHAGLSVRLADASLADAVRLLHALDADAPGPRIARLALRKHPDDPRRFDVTLEVAGDRAP